MIFVEQLFKYGKAVHSIFEEIRVECVRKHRRRQSVIGYTYWVYGKENEKKWVWNIKIN